MTWMNWTMYHISRQRELLCNLTLQAAQANESICSENLTILRNPSSIHHSTFLRHQPLVNAVLVFRIPRGNVCTLFA